MFRKRKCPRCDKEIKEDWEFCPYCGYPLKEKYRVEEKFFEEFDDFGGFEKEVFERIEKEFEELFKMPIFKIPRIKISSPRVSGISITIYSRTGMKPRIEVKTDGYYKKFEPEIKRRLGIKVPVEEVEESEEKEVEYNLPTTTEEPEAKVSKEGKKTIIEVKLPDVEKEEDIEVKRFEQSIEIRARAKDKLYFKLLPITGEIINKSFKDGVLKIEIER
jgi:HSP20 family molecular chaperone IbpA